MDETTLSSSITVRQYRAHRDAGDREAIAGLIFERFYERYLEPFKNNPAKHGFSMMASGCLMTEALYCFKKGRKKTGEAGGTAFERFFEESNHFQQFIGYGSEFYSNVRCGVLHQGETYDGWKILRKGGLFQHMAKTVNATKYLESLEKELRSYTESLKNKPFNSADWKAAVKKLDHICENCNA
jgi:hypothetical protein